MWLVSATSVIILSSWFAFLPDIAHVRLQAGCESKAETFTTLLIIELAWLAKVKGKVKVRHHLMLRPANGNTISQWAISLLILSALRDNFSCFYTLPVCSGWLLRSSLLSVLVCVSWPLVCFQGWRIPTLWPAECLCLAWLTHKETTVACLA